VKSSEAVRRGWDIVELTIRLLGMRGDMNRGELRPFVLILRRHARLVDAEAYRSLRMGPRADLLTAPAELAALVRRSRSFQKEFDAAEAQRFERYDRDNLTDFEAKIQAVVAKAESVRVPQFQMRQLDELHKLAASIPVNAAGFASRWRGEGRAALAAAVARIEALMARDTDPSRLDGIEAATKRTEQTMAKIAPTLMGVPQMVKWASDASHAPIQAADEVRRVVNLTPEEVIVRDAFLKYGEGKRVANALGLSPATVSRRKKSIIAKFAALGIPRDAIFNRRPSLETQRHSDGDMLDPSSDWREDFDGRIRTIQSYLAASPEVQTQYRDRYQDIAAEADKYERVKSGMKSRVTPESLDAP